MSIQAMNWAREQKVGSPVRKLVLLALADHCDFDGATIVGQVRLADICEMTDRGIRNVLVQLEQAGFIKRHKRSSPEGRKTDCIELAINGIFCASYDNLGRNQIVEDDSQPERESQPEQSSGSRNRNGGSGEQSVYSSKPVDSLFLEIELQSQNHSSKDLFPNEVDAPVAKKKNDEFPDWLDKEAWDGFVEMRKKIKKPLTDRAVTRMMNKLAGMHEKGIDTTAALDQSTIGCWSDVYAPKENSQQGCKPSPQALPMNDYQQMQVEKWSEVKKSREESRRLFNGSYNVKDIFDDARTIDGVASRVGGEDFEPNGADIRRRLPKDVEDEQQGRND